VNGANRRRQAKKASVAAHTSIYNSGLSLARSGGGKKTKRNTKHATVVELSQPRDHCAPHKKGKKVRRRALLCGERVSEKLTSTHCMMQEMIADICLLLD